MLSIVVNLPNLNQSLNQLNWSANSADLILLLFFALSILANIFLLQRDKIVSWTFGIYSSYLLVLFFPYQLWLSHVSLEQLVLIKVGGFFGCSLFLAIIFSRAHLLAGIFGGFISRVFQGTVLGIINVGLLLSLSATFLPLEVLQKFSGLSQNILNTDLAHWLWLVAPVILFLLINKWKKKGPGRPPSE
ncbi:MAG TPA: hypothetical protein PKZ16_01000 [bacterium]|nr:hypothetical protein [bacterium]HPL95461.1 hypothetical protein [bacterium]